MIDLGQIIETGKIRPVIDRTYHLSAVAAAIRHLIDGNVRGKIAITM